MNAMSSATLKIMSAVVLSCIETSACRRRAGRDRAIQLRPQAPRRRPGSSSSAVTKTGPIGRNVSEPLARSHWPSPFSPSRSAWRFALPVARAHVVDHDVARRRASIGRCDRHAMRGPPDDDAELDLEVEGVGPLRPDDRARRRR